jgi:hypothetical protein
LPIAVSLEKTNAQLRVPERNDDKKASLMPSRTFTLHHKLASEMADDLRQVPGWTNKLTTLSSNNLELAVTAPPEILNRVATFIAVQDWPDGGVVRGADCFYRRDNPENTMRSFFYACSTEDYDCVAAMLSPMILLTLKGGPGDAFHLDSEAKAEIARRAKADWDGKPEAIRKLVRAWNQYPLRRIRENPGVAIGFGLRYSGTASFENAPEEFTELSFVREGDGSYTNALMVDTLPPWFSSANSSFKPAVSTNH